MHDSTKEELRKLREDWLSQLQGLYKENDIVEKPIVGLSNELIEKLEKLQLKKDELERSLHPEKYMVADITAGADIMLGMPPPPGGLEFSDPPQETSSQPDQAAEDGEEPAFSPRKADEAASPSAQEGTSEPSPAKDVVPDLEAALATAPQLSEDAEKELLAELFGDFLTTDDDEPEDDPAAKRRKLDTE